MGCIWSDEENVRCLHCNRRNVNNLIIIDHVCEICLQSTTNYAQTSTSRSPRPYFGEYHCKPCGRKWNSRLCWPDKYQICKRCRKCVYPSSYRELHASDHTNQKENVAEHAKDLCQMCQQLGYACNSFNKQKRKTIRQK